MNAIFIDVNEKRKEAVAVTSITMDGASAEPENRFQMNVNRPFFFA
ncbi:serpin family protein [Paenibacillus sp. LHD-38]